MKKMIYLILFSIIFTASTPLTPLEQALRLSKKNRKQLEQVLKHYSLNPADSLKYKAADFLIRNMPGHGWYEGEELDKYNRWIDSAYQDRSFVFKAMLHEAFFRQPDATEGLKRYEDIENLDSKFLIAHIDSTFNAIKKRPWLNDIFFDQFCEYILPYRVGHERPRQFCQVQDSIFEYRIAGFLNECDVIGNTLGIFNQYNPYLSEYEEEVKLLYRGNYINYNIMGCVSKAVVKSWQAKLLFCPIALDFNPAFPTRNDRHCWSVLIDNTQLNNVMTLSSEVNKQGKIYRKTFSHNPHPVSGGKEFIPPFFREPFYKDITSSYLPTQDIDIRPLKPISTSNGYLCVFNDLKWEPVAYAEIKEGRFRFNDVGKGIVYLPVVYPGQSAVPVAFPFILNMTGNIHYLQPDTTRLITLELKRKYPLKQHVRESNREFMNSIVEATNDSLFKQVDSLGIFREISTQQWTPVKINSPESYRYWRIRSGNPFIIAECLLINSEGKNVKPVLTKARKGPKYEAAFDGNPLSYAYSDRNILQWDMGEKVALSTIECLLRNDGNNIWPGHWYELNYHDGTGWYSLGTKEATGKSVTFDNIPENSLLWLRNLTEGREERIFTYTNGKIYFW